MAALLPGSLPAGTGLGAGGEPPPDPARLVAFGAGQPAGEAMTLRDEALTALDAGDLPGALSAAGRGLAILEAEGLCGGPDEAALLVALAEIQECSGTFGDAAETIEAAIAILGDAAASGGPDLVLLWCQAQEQLAGLQRMGGEFAAAAARLGAVLDRASVVFGEVSMPVVRAANALGVVYKYAADFAAAQAAYDRAMRALAGIADPDPLIEATLLHNLGGLAHSREDPATGVPLAERGAALRAGVLGDHHPDVARDLNALGALYHLAGRLGDAAMAYRRALTIFEKSYGHDHFEVGMTCANLAVLHCDQGRYRQSESDGRRSLRILEALLGPDDAEVGLTLLNLAAAVAGRLRDAAAGALGQADIGAGVTGVGFPKLRVPRVGQDLIDAAAQHHITA